ncbi:MAG: hypothetical protein K8L99_31335 [Anaerolineae bacterium]|nr:hypothetical protein [Anaerolineae bacterium]
MVTLEQGSVVNADAVKLLKGMIIKEETYIRSAEARQESNQKLRTLYAQMIEELEAQRVLTKSEIEDHRNSISTLRELLKLAQGE